MGAKGLTRPQSGAIPASAQLATGPGSGVQGDGVRVADAPDALLEELFPDRPSAVDWGLDRMRAALAELGNPHRSYRSLHVGGTNGKGSVAATWASVLGRRGDRVGLYTSPHLCSFRERIRVDGRPVARRRLLEAAERLRPLTRDLGMPMFEAATLLALALFAEEEVDAACVEVGLGGRLDATNVIEPEVAAITNVSLDHQQFLGATVEEIAREKAGIAKPGVPLVTSETCDRALSVLAAAAAEARAPFRRVDPARHVRNARVGRDGTAFRLVGRGGRVRELRTPLPGVHQAVNAALAVAALELLPSPPSAEAIRAGVEAADWPGRGQTVRLGGRRYVFDAAHNPAAIEAATRTIAEMSPPRPLVAVVGILADKDWPRMVPAIAAAADAVVLTNPPSAPPERGWRPREARPAAERHSARVDVVEEIDAALERAAALAGEGTILVTGSCHTVGDALRALDADPLRATGGAPTAMA